MARRSKVYRKITDSATAYTRVEAKDLVSALGAHSVGPAPKAAVRYPSLAGLKLQLSAELVSEGGRPRRAGATVTRRVPLTAAEARSLDSLTAEVRQSGLNVTSGQVAGVLLRERLDCVYGRTTPSAPQSGAPVDAIAELEQTFERILAAAASAKEELEMLRPVAQELLEKMKAGRGIEDAPID